jgi:hypothetical protein
LIVASEDHPQRLSLETQLLLATTLANWARNDPGQASPLPRKAIAVLEAGLGATTEQAAPTEWVTAQRFIGLLAGLEAVNVSGQERATFNQRSIETFENSLRVIDEEKSPAQWADAQRQLATSLEFQASFASAGERPRFSLAPRPP